MKKPKTKRRCENSMKLIEQLKQKTLIKPCTPKPAQTEIISSNQIQE